MIPIGGSPDLNPVRWRLRLNGDWFWDDIARTRKNYKWFPFPTIRETTHSLQEISLPAVKKIP